MYSGSEAYSRKEEKPTACKINCLVHASGLLSAQKQGSQKKKSAAKETSGICCGKEDSAGQKARCWLKLGGGKVEVFHPACTCDMSVLDVLVHKLGARAAKIRLDKLKESENDAVMSVYSDFFFDPYDNESPQDKATREDKKKEEAELEETEEAMWSSFSVGGGLYEELTVGDIHVFPMETYTFDEIQS